MLHQLTLWRRDLRECALDAGETRTISSTKLLGVRPSCRDQLDDLASTKNLEQVSSTSDINAVGQLALHDILKPEPDDLIEDMGEHLVARNLQTREVGREPGSDLERPVRVRRLAAPGRQT